VRQRYCSSLTHSPQQMAQDGLVHTPLKFEDKIHVRDLLVQAVIGVNDNERVKNQNMIINITLWANFDAVTETDHINDTLNYRYVILFA
jgi:hypothetical protein